MNYNLDDWKDFPQTKQEIFDKVAEHLLTQRQRSGNQTFCEYFHHSGLKCAAGCLIPTVAYKRGFEGRSWFQLTKDKEVPDLGETFISQLQRLHDTEPVDRWFSLLKRLAVCNNLEWKFDHLRKETDRSLKKGNR